MSKRKETLLNENEINVILVNDNYLNDTKYDYQRENLILNEYSNPRC